MQGIKKHTRIEYTFWVAYLFGGRKHLAEKRVDFTFIAAAMIASNCVVVRNRAAVGDHGFVRCLFDFTPASQCGSMFLY